ncbi:hypothetical protein CBM2633_B80123 [Cupriavidus taiwanensis]|uniref:Uncharacterized protein n=1 Tax=Cupriavidus taiwanensis TaxID=164546 RepID=A0A375E6N7_9BURK|nr:hypothetical protein CBM2614_B140027 [Cupriavidus taiwanensis]SOZ64075.1 hypothetical protein CBM2615_B140027 [Cupriavidus taiwanensis]SOZ67837.1 hypothetical protein CBM2613_B110027 [Cupriavidus taiwanensis]SPA01275.1 hypothetical protein CBM2626_B110217 [Cupriavidus taiwanensis]SPA07753.1 hypothetical protein CBM2625_B110028 [Cupriavidus taiwanensis]
MTRQGVTAGGGGSGTEERLDEAPALSRTQGFGPRSCHALSFHRMISCKESFYRMICPQPANASIIPKNDFSH